MKKPTLKVIMVLLIPVLLACNLSSLVGGAQPAPAPVSQSQTVSAQPTAALSDLEGQARQVVSSFLTALREDPSGQKSLPLLSEALQQQVNGGMPVAQLAGLENGVPEFTLSAANFGADAASASVDASILLQQPVNRRFHLVLNGGQWKIDQIYLLEAGESYPPTPEEVVQSFLSAYQEAPDTMSRYLSAQRLAELPPGGAVAMLDIRGTLEGMMIESVAVSPNPPRASVTVSIQSGGEATPRVFDLTKENNQWRINTITIP